MYRTDESTRNNFLVFLCRTWVGKCAKRSRKCGRAKAGGDVDTDKWWVVVLMWAKMSWAVRDIYEQKQSELWKSKLGLEHVPCTVHLSFTLICENIESSCWCHSACTFRKFWSSQSWTVNAYLSHFVIHPILDVADMARSTLWSRLKDVAFLNPPPNFMT